MRRDHASLSMLTVAAVAAAGVAFTAPAATASTASTATATAVATATGPTPSPPVVTNFAFKHTAFGSQVKGNAAVGSGRTAYSFLPCTRKAGVSDRNEITSAGDGTAVNLGVVKSYGFTARKDGVVEVVSRNSISRGALAERAVTFTGLTARARTFHNRSGFHTKALSKLTSLTVAGIPVEVTGRQQRIDVPGVGTLTVNQKSRSVRTNSAQVAVNVLKLVADDGTVTRVGHAFSRMDGMVTGGLFRGGAWASQAFVNDVASSGKTARQPIPCPGTRGKVRTNSTAMVGIPGVGSLSNAESSARGEQRVNSAGGFTRSRIESARFAGGELRLRGIVARANVKRQADGDLVRNAKGTKIARIVLNGEEQTIPARGERLDLPGVGFLTVGNVDRVRNGIEVIGVRLVLFQRNGQPRTEVELAHAILRISRS